MHSALQFSDKNIQWVLSNFIVSQKFCFQVLSEEEQDALAAIPAHPAGLYGKLILWDWFMLQMPLATCRFKLRLFFCALVMKDLMKYVTEYEF